MRVVLVSGNGAMATTSRSHPRFSHFPIKDLYRRPRCGSLPAATISRASLVELSEVEIDFPCFAAAADLNHQLLLTAAVKQLQDN